MTDANEGESESTWSSLSRRKVVQWGVAYVAGAWVLLQGLEYLSDGVRLARVTSSARSRWRSWSACPSRWCSPGTTATRSPTDHDSRVRDPDAAVAARRRGVLVLRAHASANGHDAAPRVARTVGRARIIRSLRGTGTSWRCCPLPTSRTHDQEYFSDGLTEEILNQLAQMRRCG